MRNKDMTKESKKPKRFEKLLVDSWYNRAMPRIDLDRVQDDKIVGKYCNEYQMTREAWIKSIRKDLKKYYFKRFES